MYWYNVVDALTPSCFVMRIECDLESFFLLISYLAGLDLKKTYNLLMFLKYF